MTKTIAVFGAGPGMGRAVARRFGREGFQVALVARNQDRLDAFTRELAADGIEAAGFAGDMADRDALPGMIEAITARFGPIDVLEYAPSGLDLLNVATAVRDADAASFEFPFDLLLRTPVTLIRQVLPGMLRPAVALELSSAGRIRVSTLARTPAENGWFALQPAWFRSLFRAGCHRLRAGLDLRHDRPGRSRGLSAWWARVRGGSPPDGRAPRRDCARRLGRSALAGGRRA
jgi:NAD(P)-dependent dehydrogenase (short-subunit alcohol dehydrogenase family)